MNKSEIAGRLASRMALSKYAATGAVDAVFEVIGEALAEGENVRIAGFGTFTTRSRSARTGRNPRTGESVSIPASKTPVFKAGTVRAIGVTSRRCIWRGRVSRLPCDSWHDAVSGQDRVMHFEHRVVEHSWNFEGRTACRRDL